MSTNHRSLYVWGVGSMFLWGTMALASPAQQQQKGIQKQFQEHQAFQKKVQEKLDQQEEQGQQGQQLQKLKRLAFVLAYLRSQKDDAISLRDVVKAKLVTARVKKFADRLRDSFQDTDRDVQDLADRLQVRIDQYEASTPEEQEEMEADSSMMEKLQEITADREGEQEFLGDCRDWLERTQDRLATLAGQVEEEEATPVLDRIQSRIQDLRERAQELIED